MTEDLEKIAEKGLDKKKGAFKRFLVDGATLVAFSIPVGRAIDIFVAGMSYDKSTIARLWSIPINLAFGRYQGRYDDYVRKKMDIKEESHWMKKAAAGTFSFGTFEGALYGIITGLSGAEPSEILRGVGFVSLAALGLGWLYDYMLDEFREIFGTKSYYQQLEELKLYGKIT